MADVVSTVALTDVGIKLMKKNDAGQYEMLVPVTKVPDTGGAPNKLKVTTLDSFYEQYVSDRPETPTYDFEYNHTEPNFAAVNAYVSLTAAKDFLIVYQGGSGEHFQGTGSTWVGGYSGGQAGKCSLAINVSEHDHVADTSTMIATV